MTPTAGPTTNDNLTFLQRTLQFQSNNQEAEDLSMELTEEPEVQECQSDNLMAGFLSQLDAIQNRYQEVLLALNNLTGILNSSSTEENSDRGALQQKIANLHNEENRLKIELKLINTTINLYRDFLPKR
ncbi:MAG: hypothetical protein JSR58_07650 [Verrucomicrobia bacterium]|nr:hypothetical protein [Verrucomicrobiota bacterium]